MSTQVDVLVVGGGSAGVAASLAAARSGARVMLATNHPFVGGNMTSGLPLLGFHDAEGRQVVRGIPDELVERLESIGGSPGHVVGDPVLNSVTPIDPILMRCVVNDALHEDGVLVQTHTTAVEALTEDSRVTGVRVLRKHGFEEVHADCVIDATGDGDVAASAGAAFEFGDPDDAKVQSATLMFILDGIDRAELVDYLKANPDDHRAPSWCLDQEAFVVVGLWSKVAEAWENGEFPAPQARVILSTLPRVTQMAINTTRVEDLDAVDGEALSRAEAEAQSQIIGIWDFFRKYVPGCAGSYPIFIAHQIGIRESRRVVGDYVLTSEDVVDGADFEDSVACGGYDIDIHYPDPDAEVPGYHVKTKAYGIPYRCLLPRDLDGLLVAGKVISATHEAFGSTRVMGTTMATGQAAGVAAQMASQDGISPREVPVSDLRERLRSQDVIVGPGDVA